jgi:uncharacterized membrane protein
MGVFYRPRCPKCKATMLARITPGSSGLGIRTLACPVINEVPTVLMIGIVILVIVKPFS